LIRLDKLLVTFKCLQSPFVNFGDSDKSANMLTVGLQLPLVEFGGHYERLNPVRESLDTFINTHPPSD
jgi:hypothetical protein